MVHYIRDKTLSLEAILKTDAELLKEKQETYLTSVDQPSVP
jgi:hypothetical protein